MKRIIVIGSPGAGKSTFARQLRDITGLPLYYLDFPRYMDCWNSMVQEKKSIFSGQEKMRISIWRV